MSRLPQVGRRAVRAVAGNRVAARRMILAFAAAVAGCGGASQTPAIVSPERLASAGGDPSELYREAGFLSAHGDVQFVGSVRFLIAPSSDSTLALVSFSLANAALTFAREGDRWRAGYD